MKKYLKIAIPLAAFLLGSFATYEILEEIGKWHYVPAETKKIYAHDATKPAVVLYDPLEDSPRDSEFPDVVTRVVYVLTTEEEAEISEILQNLRTEDGHWERGWIYCEARMPVYRLKNLKIPLIEHDDMAQSFDRCGISEAEFRLSPEEFERLNKVYGEIFKKIKARNIENFPKKYFKNVVFDDFFLRKFEDEISGDLPVDYFEVCYDELGRVARIQKFESGHFAWKKMYIYDENREIVSQIDFQDTTKRQSRFFMEMYGHVEFSEIQHIEQ